MRLAFILALTLLSACRQRRADAPPRWEARADLGCSGRQLRQVTAAVESARRAAQACLVEKKLNPKLGAALSALLDGGISFDCVQNVTNFGGTTFRREGRTRVWLQMTEPLPAHADLSRVVFHEALHAADQRGDFELADRAGPHNDAGSTPDAVRACEFVCSGQSGDPVALDAWVGWHEELAGPLPSKDDWPCEGPRCAVERKLARICARPEEAAERAAPFQPRMRWSLCAARVLRGPKKGRDEAGSIPLAREIMRGTDERLAGDLKALTEAGRLDACGPRPAS